MPSVHTNFFLKKAQCTMEVLKAFYYFFLSVFYLFFFIINHLIIEYLVLLASLKIWGFDSLCGPYSGHCFLLLFKKSCFLSWSLQNIYSLFLS